MTVEGALLRARDGATSEARVARADGADAVVLVAPAMGVAAAYYDPLALALAAAGFHAVVLEHRGQGSSSVRPGRGVDFGYEDLVRNDWPPALELARSLATTLGRPRVVVLGHSLGGQLAALALAEDARAFDALALVASSTVDFRGWRGAAGLSLLIRTQLAAGIATALGVFPGDRFGFGGRQPPRLIRDWARQARTGRLAPAGAPIDHERALADRTIEVLSIAIEGDELAPEDACRRLVLKLPAARVERRTIAPRWTVKRASDAHLRWAREPAAIVEELASFLRGDGGGQIATR